MAAPLSVSTTSLPAATIGQAYSATLAATGGTSPYTWSVTSGTLPAGLSLNASTGVISGTPTSPGTASFTAGVTDSSSPPQSASQPLSITTGGCTTTIIGGAGFTAGPGVTCVTGGTVHGPVTVPAGATLAITGATISGSLHATGAALLSICGSTVTGPVNVSGSTGPVQIGGAGCAPSTITGPVTLSGNTGGIQLSGTTITGPVTVNNNTGGTVVAASNITGSLGCTGNSPPPTDNGQPSTAHSATGQCSGLA